MVPAKSLSVQSKCKFVWCVWAHASGLAGVVFERYVIHKKERDDVGDDEGPRKVVYVFACTSCIFKHTTSAEQAKFFVMLVYTPM